MKPDLYTKIVLTAIAGLLIAPWLNVADTTVSAQSEYRIRAVSPQGEANAVMDQHGRPLTGTVIGFSCTTAQSGTAVCYALTR